MDEIQLPSEMKPPPDPTGINKFPEDPKYEIIFEKNLDVVSSIVPLSTLLTTLTFPRIKSILGEDIEQEWSETKLTIKRKWDNYYQRTIDSDEEFQHTEEILYGVQSSETHQTGFGASIGAKSDLLSINTTLENKTERKFVLTQHTKDSYTLTKKPKTKTTVCWWQEVWSFKTTGKINYFAFINPLGLKKVRVKIGSQDYVHEIEERKERIAQTQYPDSN